MYRNAMNDLYKWKAKKDKKPLIIRGARQVGKTWLMREFGRVAFKDMVLKNINLKQHNIMSRVSNQKQTETKPAIQTLILKASPRKWLGCVYISDQEATGQLIMFLESQSGEFQGKFLNRPIYVIQASCKSILEAALLTKVQSVITLTR